MPHVTKRRVILLSTAFIVAIFAWQLILPGYLYYHCERLILLSMNDRQFPRQFPYGKWFDQRGIYSYDFDEPALTVDGTPFEGSSRKSMAFYRKTVNGPTAHLYFSRVERISGYGDFGGRHDHMVPSSYNEMIIRQNNHCSMSIDVIYRNDNKIKRIQLTCEPSRQQ